MTNDNVIARSLNTALGDTQKAWAEEASTGLPFPGREAALQVLAATVACDWLDDRPGLLEDLTGLSLEVWRRRIETRRR